jgi:hypothetical protein
MERRGFLGLLVAAIPAIPVLERLTLELDGQSKDGYIFEWRSVKGPDTNDPKYKGKLKTGKHNHVFVEGIEYGPSAHITRFKTGHEGFLEGYVTDQNGKFVCEDGQVQTYIVLGHVEYKPDPI